MSGLDVHGSLPGDVWRSIVILRVVKTLPHRGQSMVGGLGPTRRGYLGEKPKNWPYQQVADLGGRDGGGDPSHGGVSTARIQIRRLPLEGYSKEQPDGVG